MLHALSLSGVLYALWLLLSGYFDPLLMGLGLGSVFVVVFTAIRMDVVDHEGHPIHLSWRAMLYWPWLILEIVKSSISVARVVLSPAMPIKPSVFKVKASQVTELGHVLYANSITLTPGTVTLALHNGYMDVHALTEGAKEDLLSGEMDRRVHAVEGQPDGTTREGQ